MDINRREFFKLAGVAAVAAVGSMGLNIGLYGMINDEIYGNVAIKQDFYLAHPNRKMGRRARRVGVTAAP